MANDAFSDPHAMMDLSDGVAADLPTIGARPAAQDSVVERARLPVTAGGCTVEQALGDGEDYELLFALSLTRRPPNWRKFMAAQLFRI